MAGSLIGQLKVVLGLETAGFETGARRAAKQVDEFGGKAERLGAKIGGIGKALGVAAVAFAGSALFSTLKDLTMQGLEYASGLKEQAQQLGVSAKAMQEYRYAASQVGIEQADMDQGLAQLTKRIGQAAEGAKKPAAAFRELGISLRDSQGNLLTAGDAIPKIADALAKIPDPAQRAALEVDLFGKSGQKLDNLLSGGSAAVNGLRDAAHSLGIVIDDKLIDNADDAADKMSKLKQILSAQIASVVAANAKEITELTSALMQFAIEALKAANAWLKFRNVSNTINAQTAKANAIIDQRGDLTPAQKSQARDYASELIRQRNGVKRTKVAGGGLFTIYRDEMKNQFGVGNGPFAAYAPGPTNYLAQLMSADAVAGVAEGLDRVTEVMGSAAEKAKAYAVQMDRSFAESADGIIYSLDRMAGAFRGGSFLDKLGAVLNFGMQLGGAGVFGNKIAANINSIPHRAMGGPVLAGRMHLVGENGPELFVPGSNGGIVPNHALGGGGRYYFQGNLMTPEFWAMIQAGDLRAAQAGAMGGERRVAFRSSRRVA